MALVKCKECGEQVSTKAKTCPKCGAKAPKKTSFFTWLVLIFIIIVVYTACQDSSPTSKPTAYQDLSPTSKPTAAKPKSAWEYIESRDEMSGDVTRAIVGRSKNTLTGWLSSGKVLLFYTFGQGFFVVAEDLGFAVDDIDCDQYGCKSIQFARVKFDDGPPSNIMFSVLEDNHDGMSLQKTRRHSSEDKETFLINAMKAGAIMYLELELFNTKGNQQVAEFDLTGFTKAFNQYN